MTAEEHPFHRMAKRASIQHTVTKTSVLRRELMKLYYYPVSTYSRRVRVALLEKNIPCELLELNLPGREHKEEWYAALNPYTKVPTLVDGDLTLY